MLEIKHLYKKFGSFYAVEDLNLYIDKGEIFGFVGHNGAGKTTTMKITAGLLAATGGSITINGADAFKNRRKMKRKIGYMPDFFGVYDNLKAIEYMEFYASLYGITGKKAKTTCMNLMELVNLSDKANAYVDSLSRGMKQRLCLARSLVHDPELLLLDEPASGLDPRARFEMKEILKNLGSMGKTIIISSHILPELADMCDTIGIMQKGKLIMHGTVEDIQLKAMHAKPLHIRVLKNQETAMRVLKEDPHTRRVSAREDYLVADYTGDEMDTARLLRRLMLQGVLIESFYKEKGNLESLFLELTSEEGIGKYTEADSTGETGNKTEADSAAEAGNKTEADSTAEADGKTDNGGETV
ncbi:MAG: ABC transporter ATP-binding protein [Lachnospiraceae bacterium]|nr:ABC transporter ATP-binding protein [Lachnospiraceae bacterium]